jgi:uncharacterized protein YjdB
MRKAYREWSNAADRGPACYPLTKSFQMRAIRVFRALLCLLLAGATACARKPASIQVSPHKVLLYGIDRSQRLTARLLDSKGQPIEGGRVTWASSKPDTATVDDAGRVVAKGEGKARVTASVGEITTDVPVEVVDAATIEIVPGQVVLAGPVGTTLALAGSVKSSKNQPLSMRPTWKSSDEKVVTVTPDGALTSVGNGTTAVTAQLGELQAVAEITVMVRDIARLEVRPATALVRVGDSQRFEIVAFGPDGARLENAIAQFHSSNPAVATIDGAGVASGIGAGTATIRADLAGRVAEATLIVN